MEVPAFKILIGLSSADVEIAGSALLDQANNFTLLNQLKRRVVERPPSDVHSAMPITKRGHDVHRMGKMHKLHQPFNED
ncbi:hypothetical protein [Bradyrhizobium sp. BR 1432]|uniref:hypothetical protein n=1 Tax=Bradyrhizobium sp. BR 1432 TaxID=3447966 RepID=UPI003EE6C612